MPVPSTVMPTFEILLSADPPRLTAGSLTGSSISVRVRRNDSGQPPEDGTEIVLDTSLGNFGVTPQGDPIQLVRLSLKGGEARTTLLADAEDVGTAVLLAQLSDSSAQLTVAIGEPGDLPSADFEFAVDGLSVTFADTSTGNPSSWAWDFGDGSSSTQQSPTHTFSVAGTYAVKLTVSNGAGSNGKTQLVTVPSGGPPEADFSFQVEGLKVFFLDASTGNPESWAWNFGDEGSSENTSDQQNPSHTYGTAGTYTVSLTVTNAAGSASASQLVTVTLGDPPTADFSFQVEGLKVFFLDTSTGDPSKWTWDFGGAGVGEGNDPKSQQNPVFTYNAAGTYTVSLTVENAAGSDTTAQLVTVTLGDAPTADFSFQIEGLKVFFFDASTGNPDQWMWDFGGAGAGEGSNPESSPNPVYTYDAAGTYTVSLTASNAAGSDTAAQTVTVSLGTGPVADFSFVINKRQVIFTDRSTGDPTAWSWDFGDGSQGSMEQSPDHCYADDGTYLVRLTASNDAGSSSSSQFVTVSDPDNTACPGS